MTFVTDYPAWFVLFCALLGGIYTFLLYFRSKKEDTSKWIRTAMMVFRFLSVTIIAFLLLSPLIRKKSEIIEKPVIIVAQDNSGSILFSKDSSWYSKTYPSQIEALVKDLSSKFETVPLSFGDGVKRGLTTDFKDNRTDMSQLFDEISSRFANRNVGALIIASDGIYNHGASPFYKAEKFNFPVYTIALGDTSVHRDVIIKKINHNRNVFTGDRFPVEIMIEGDMVAGERTEVRIMQDDKVIGSKQISFPVERSFQKVSFLIEAKEKGIRKYTAVVVPVKNELSEFNNSQDFYVEVTDTRQKIAILYSSPHPDVAAIRSALEASAKYEIEDFQVNEFNQPADKYDLIILSQIPASNTIFSAEKLMNSSVSLLFILGSQSSVDQFNALKSGLSITSFKGSYNETLPALNPDFALFTVGKNVADMLAGVPPLVTPFGNYQFSPASEVLTHQKIGNVKSGLPQIFFIETPGKKTGIIAGENIWKWRLSDYLQNENHLAFDELIEKIAQYLSVKGDKSFFRLKVSTRFLENEEITMEAEVYNESYELINDPDVNISITNEEGKKFTFVMGKTGKAYTLSAGIFKPGRYSYTGTVKTGKNSYTRTGEFVVSAINLESINTIADHNLMFRLAKSHGGEMVYPADMQKLTKMIGSREDVRPVSYIQKRYSDLVGNLLVFLLILGLLSAEWFLRKRSGNY